MPSETLYPPALICGGCFESTNETVVTVEDVEICWSCEDEAETCGQCLRLTRHGLNETVGNIDVCWRCAEDLTECGRCGLLASSTREAASGDEICTTCRINYYWECARPGCDYILNSGSYCDGCWESEYSSNTCSCCTSDSDSDSGPSPQIYNYSYKPYPMFHGEGPLYLGLELEINTPYRGMDECAQVAVDALGSLGYLKEDGSISQGFEIVTHPMSHEYSRTQFPWHMLRDLAGRGCDGDDTGLHVHVSRKGFSSPSHVFRWLKFLYRNSEHVSVIARRESSNWAAWDSYDRMRAKEHAKGSTRGDRYRAINVTNDATFEVRVFKASLKEQQVRAALDLVAGSVEYTRELTVADINARGGWTWSAFTAWAAVRPEYVALTREVEGNLACAC